MASSAMQALLDLERQYSEQIPPASEASAEVMVWMGAALKIAGTGVLVGQGELEEIIEVPNITPIPGSKPWVLGLAGHKGSLLPIFSGDSFFRNQAYTGRPREYCMVIKRPGFHFGMTVSGIERDLSFPAEKRDMNHPVDPDFANHSLGGFHHHGQFFAVLDIDRLISDRNFASAAAAQV